MTGFGGWGWGWEGQSYWDTCLSLHHSPQVEGDAADDVDLSHGVGPVLVPVCGKAVLFGVT